jgi:hypothetical protein
MEQSNEKLKNQIKKYGFYVYTKNLAEYGLGLIIFEENNEIVSGIKLIVGGNEKFEMTRQSFESLIIYDVVNFIELLPKTVWKSFYKIYKK